MATRAKGRPSRNAIDAGWPYQVEIDVPERGFGRHLGTIMAWLHAHVPPPQHCRGSSPRGLEAVRWAFRDFGQAEAFQRQFGGRLLDAGDENPRSLKTRRADARPISEILTDPDGNVSPCIWRPRGQ